jgi:micrococcal nuclease
VKKFLIIFLIIIVTIISIIIFNPFQSNDLVEAKVLKVFDGDTIFVQIHNENYVVRLIGINTPETKGKYNEKDEYYGPEASKFLKELLPIETSIYLENDIGNEDKYNRLLRYVFIKPNGEMINSILLQKGYAEVMTINPNIKYAKEFEKIEQNAKKNKIGRWK